MIERGHHAAGLAHLAGSTVALTMPTLAAIGEHLAPRRDDQRVAVGLAALGMLAALRGRED